MAPKWMRTDRCFVFTSMKATRAATICPSTVAVAAPRTPMAGKGPTPNISSGSKMMLKMAPVAWEAMEAKVLPVATSSFSKFCPKNAPAETTHTMLRYWIPSSTISPTPVCIR